MQVQQRLRSTTLVDPEDVGVEYDSDKDLLFTWSRILYLWELVVTVFSDFFLAVSCMTWYNTDQLQYIVQ